MSQGSYGVQNLYYNLPNLKAVYYELKLVDRTALRLSQLRASTAMAGTSGGTEF